MARGFTLATPDSCTTRPTSVLLRRRFFDSHQDFSDSLFVDLCAGSGAVGIEACSRGAKEVYLVENCKKAFRCLKNNGHLFKEKYPQSGSLNPVLFDFEKWIERSEDILASYLAEDTYLYFDPPYEKINMYEQFFKLITQKKVSARIIVEACQQKTMSLAQFEKKFGVPVKTFKQGTSFLAIYDL
ncbi:MAG: hypothetical protein HON90_02225 [Halobacteriovoraceae bacterium]|nr:hypothetical protein [Halobacteriovoraceae bacterium]